MDHGDTDTVKRTHYDTIIVGAGHNGLVCANYLARSGKRVLVLEAAEQCGGLAASYEFHPGFKASVAQYATHLPTQIVDDLRLTDHGYRSGNLDLVGLSPAEPPVRLNGANISGAVETDAAAFQEYHRLMDKLAQMFQPFWQKTVPPIGNNSLSEIASFAQLGLKIRMLGKQDMQEFFRIVALPMYDLLDEFVTSPVLKAMLSWDGLIGTKQAPRSPNNSVLQLLYRLQNRSEVCVDVASLVDALLGAARAAGVEIRTDAPVAKVEVESRDGPAGAAADLTATGVTLESGERIAAGQIISSADPRSTFLNLTGAEHLDIEFTNRIDRYRDRGMVTKVHLALSGVPDFSGLDQPDGRMVLAPDVETIEWAFDNAKYGELPQTPVMEVMVPSLHNSALAPAGQHVLSANVMYTPFAVRGDEASGGWSVASRAALLESVLHVLERYSPSIQSQLVGTQLLTPQDLERSHRVSGGHWHHGDFALDQLIMMRPTHGAAQYKTPIEGLMLCGAGTHPAGDLTGLPGFNAAREALK
ncbi:MAG: NAD(P)/FAD-dependent oxidoreductase [Pseudomonadota bacterium]